MRRAARSARTVTSAPTNAAGTMHARGELTRRRATGPDTNATKATGPRRGDAECRQADTDEHQHQLGAADVHPEPCRCVIAEVEAIEVALHQDRQRPQHRECDGDDANLVPTATVQRAGQPHCGALHVVDLGAGDQVVDRRRDREPCTDADEHQAVRLQRRASMRASRPPRRQRVRLQQRPSTPGRCWRRSRRSSRRRRTRRRR